MDSIAKNYNWKKLKNLCELKNNQQNIQINENEWKWYQYDDILNDNWLIEDLDENATHFGTNW